MYRTRLIPIAAARLLMAGPATAAFAAPGHATTSQPAGAVVCNGATELLARHHGRDRFDGPAAARPPQEHGDGRRARKGAGQRRGQLSGARRLRAADPSRRRRGRSPGAGTS